MSRDAGRSHAGWVLLLGVLMAACTGSGVSVAPGTRPDSVGAALETDRSAAYRKMLATLDKFHVAGGIRTDDGLLLPEIITIEIRSEVCVESREPGARFWSLEYDTCFVYVAVDTAGADGEYSVEVPCLDADQTYESRHAFGDLRLVQRGPVSFLAASDAGWRHQETFTSSRSQRRDLVLSLDTDTFWVVEEEARLRSRPDGGAETLGVYPFGAGIPVIRFNQGWAECRVDGRIGWMEMQDLGTEEEMKLKAPLMLTPVPKVRPLREAGDSPGT